ncbi:MAG TPA: hypothetical protein VMY42_01995 [Thermoguttaceae bacterium]|nr:hypothetical protein [Thermoguttaceae bacterium]
MKTKGLPLPSSSIQSLPIPVKWVTAAAIAPKEIAPTKLCHPK